MSNPFRRVHLDTSAPGTTSIQPLSINTGSRPEKHVRIASPPDTAISPASYPPSPVFTRLSPTLKPPISTPQTTSRIENPVGNLFDADDSGGEDGAITEALKNTRLNSIPGNTDGAPEAATGGNAVQNTLSKFASRPKDARQGNESAQAPQKAGPARLTMDVDAFTRLLLTGGVPQPGAASTVSAPGQNISDSSSNADSASASRQSIFEPLPPISTDSPRSSQDLDDNYRERKPVAAGDAAEKSRKAPPTPKPRHGKPIGQDSQRRAADSKRQYMQPEAVSPDSDLTDKPLPPTPEDNSFQTLASSTTVVGTDPSMQIKRPPTPPISRRRSQMSGSKPPLSRSSPSMQSLTTTSQSPASSSSLSLASKAPPPPPSRRISQRIPSTDLPSTSEELATDPMEQVDFSRPIMPMKRTTSSATHSSLTGADTPPLPPPRRRNRGLSRSSVDSQRPASLTKNNDEGGGGDVRRPSADSGRSASGPPRDILSDLASLQKEVDALRAQRREI